MYVSLNYARRSSATSVVEHFELSLADMALVTSRACIRAQGLCHKHGSSFSDTAGLSIIGMRVTYIWQAIMMLLGSPSIPRPTLTLLDRCTCTLVQQRCC